MTETGTVTEPVTEPVTEGGTIGPSGSQRGAPRRWPTVGVRPFEELVRTEGPTVWRVCRALLGPVDAEDAWSDTFLSALRAYPRLEPGSNERGWLVTIAHRRALDVIRARNRRAVPDAEPPERPAQEATDPHQFDELWQALDALPARQRHAVVYRHLAGLSYDEVAALLDSSPTSARRSVADGMAKLRRDPRLQTPTSAPPPAPTTNDRPPTRRRT